MDYETMIKNVDGKVDGMCNDAVNAFSILISKYNRHLLVLYALTGASIGIAIASSVKFKKFEEEVKGFFNKF